jgi:dTDP-4-dehydrorhamnose 3,5-epimerase
MVLPIHSELHKPPDLTLEDFIQDSPRAVAAARVGALSAPPLIDGVSVTELVRHSDSRGSLSELLTMRDPATEPIVHVYQVAALAGSIRAWVMHRRQDDRLAFLNGRFRIVLYDIRPGSSTCGLLNVFVLGFDRPALLCIPSNVIHGVQNLGDAATFINLPTIAYDPRDPDKYRLAADDPRVPFRFDE